MNILKTFTGLALASFLGGCLTAGDYDQLLDVLARTWPNRHRAAVICSMDFNQMALMDLTDSAKSRGMSTIVMNVKEPRELKNVLNVLLQKRPDYLILVDEDPILGVKSPNTRMIIQQAAARGVPTVALTQEGLNFGALFAVGPTTNNKILKNEAAAKKLKFELPEGDTVSEEKK